MSFTLNTKAYAFDTNPSSDVGRHVGPAHTLSVKDLIDLKRVMPKPTSTFAGVARAGVKIARTVTLSSGAKAEAIVEVSSSLPVGMVQADVDSIRDDLGDLLISSNGSDLFWKQKINQ